MRRTTIYLEPDLELRLKREAARRKTPMATLIRDALHQYLDVDAGAPPPGAGAFKSGRRETAERAEVVLRRTRFGRDR